MKTSIKHMAWVMAWVACWFTNSVSGQAAGNNFRVIAYYASNAANIDSFAIDQLTHIIYSFCHLKGNRLEVDNKGDSLTIQKLVSLKVKYPKLKVLLSLGGWGGCKTCSGVFDTDEGRKEFATSVKELADYFKTDGIDLDWEYPAIEGYPGHPFKPEDKNNFTALVKALRVSLGQEQEISFAAGAFPKFLEQSIDWAKVMPVVDYVNLMNYDMVHGNTPHTGHHTPLYSTDDQKESVHACVSYLESIGVSRQQMVIGAAFYGRSWGQVENVNHGLYQPGVFKNFLSHNIFDRIVNKRMDLLFIMTKKRRLAMPIIKSKKSL
ncbi:glycoside hydrolase family 18 protein [Niabella hibiscisoli]|uniref:glycoside hydrolase family 18 protein n=1 Tax=Niabella hibiscisoli TaxID=1825928 RepID=UPI001F0E5A5B|nr:glycosyl hydrolase family 18 protein [Niabella hibiscisoli]MCH5716956.1 glycosyl hydrolase family 18 protein [Niabella hibiscisoli]